MTRVQRELHRRVWLAMLVVIPLLSVLALRMRAQRASALTVQASAQVQP